MNSIVATFILGLMVFCQKAAANQYFDELASYDYDDTARQLSNFNDTNTAFAIGAMFGGIAGSFFATKQGFVSPESFTFIESAIIFSS